MNIGSRLAVVVLIFQTACASILTGTSDRVNFNSDPDDAKVTAEGNSCKTPCSLELSRRENHTIVFSKEGYRSKQDTTAREFNPIALLNFLGLVGWIVDFGTGAVWRIKPSSYSAEMSPAASK